MLLFLKCVGVQSQYTCTSFEIYNVLFFLCILVVDPVTRQPLEEMASASEENESSTTVVVQHEGKQLPLLRQLIVLL